MSHPLRPVVLVALAALAACAPTQEWVNPAAPVAAREADLGGCNAAAWTYARQRSFLFGPRVYGPYWGPWGAARMSQANTLETLDRNRYFEDCMQLRGYTLQPVAPP